MRPWPGWTYVGTVGVGVCVTIGLGVLTVVATGGAGFATGGDVVVPQPVRTSAMIPDTKVLFTGFA